MVAQPVKPSTSISTHAPAGGATRLLPRSDEHRGNFYSRPCGRGDPTRCCRAENLSLFLLTPLREGRLTMSDSLKKLQDFYSRPCGRGDCVPK